MMRYNFKITGLKAILSFFALSAVVETQGQINQYNYLHELSGVNSQWHKVELPSAMYGRVQKSLADIRIYGIKANGDTIEAPYILKQHLLSPEKKNVSFNLINSSKTKDAFFYTYEIIKEDIINEIDLNFGLKNFDFKVKLEGSQDQVQWFSIADNYRMVSISNDYTRYSFTKLRFADAKFRYYRLMIDTKTDPQLLSAQLTLKANEPAQLKQYAVASFTSGVLRNENRSFIRLVLPEAVPVSRVKLNVASDVDFYRPVEIKHPIDSFKTEQEMQYVYAPLLNATLSSVDTSAFQFPETIARQIIIDVSDYDNMPLKYISATVAGPVYELVCRIDDKQAKYFLVYGNSNAQRPMYDLNNFPDKIPTTILPLQLGKEQKVGMGMASDEPLLKSRAWLWAVILIAVVLMGWFTLKMVKNKTE